MFICLTHTVICPFLLKPEEESNLTAINATVIILKWYKYRIQISPYNCTGCGTCAENCPVSDLSIVKNSPFFASIEDKNFSYHIFLSNKGYLTTDNNVKTFWFDQQLI
jgi:pyruvate-ferredoxin/flavodoxin oxidoreductase